MISHTHTHTHTHTHIDRENEIALAFLSQVTVGGGRMKENIREGKILKQPICIRIQYNE
jgi:ATP-dependent protease HslVU (ClpYQ) peptidase subunit